MTPKRTQRILDALDDKRVDQPCPRCLYTRFDLVTQTRMPITSWPLSESGLPVAVVACRRCGFVSFHALGPLLDPNSTAGDPPEAEEAETRARPEPPVNGSVREAPREPAAAGAADG
jgi:predicted nucleic-acid-binding Zn-ribbon protein